MSDAAIRAALEAAAKHLCICNSECFETRHGMMHGPCEMPRGKAAAAITAFLRARATTAAPNLPVEWMHECAAAVERRAKEIG